MLINKRVPFIYPVHGSIAIAAGVCTVTIGRSVRWIAPSASTWGGYVVLDISGRTFYFYDDNHGSSHLTGLNFGITPTQDWAVDMPFFLYLVNEDDTPGNVGCFFSRLPNRSATPGAGYIHDWDAAGAFDGKDNIFGMWNDDAGKATKPCSLIGAFRMRYALGTTDWTVQTVSNVLDGVGEDRINACLSFSWTMADRQNTANAIVNNYLRCTNTPPLWATPANTVYRYRWHRDGWMDVNFTTINAGACTNGTNPDNLQLCLPIIPSGTFYLHQPYIPVGYGAINNNPSGNPDELINMEMAQGTHSQWLESSVFSIIQADDFNNAGDDLMLAFSFCVN